MRLYKFAEQTGSHTEAVKERTSPWKLGGLTPLQLSKRVYHEIDEDEVLTRSAALAYYFVSALFPMIFFLMAMLGLFAQSHDLQSSLLNYTARFMPGDAYSLVQKTMQGSRPTIAPDSSLPLDWRLPSGRARVGLFRSWTHSTAATT